MSTEAVSVGVPVRRSLAARLAQHWHLIGLTAVLGYVGSTGNANGTPPHLHFGIYTTNGAINPLPLLVDRPQEKRVTPKADKKPAKKKR